MIQVDSKALFIGLFGGLEGTPTKKKAGGIGCVHTHETDRLWS